MLRPTGYLAFQLDPDTRSADRAASLSRAFSYVSPVTVQNGETNRIVLKVKLSGRPFWNAKDAEQQRIWEEVVAPWLAIRLRKIQETLQEYNNAETKSYCGAVVFEDIIINLDGRTVQCAIIDDQLVFAADLIDRMRSMEGDAESGARFTAPTPETAATFERRTEETTATMSRPPEPGSNDDETEDDGVASSESTFKPRRLTIKERDALRRDPFGLITDLQVTNSDGETRILSFL